MTGKATYKRSTGGATQKRGASVSSIPQSLSTGEELLAQHLTCYGIEFQREVQLIQGRKYRWDFYIRAKDLAIEISGQTWQKGGHSSGSGIIRDYRKSNAATLAGIKVLHFTTQQVESGEAIDTVRAIIQSAK